MKWLRRITLLYLVALGITCTCTQWLFPDSYAEQDREAIDAAPSSAHLLGTDDLGRDRLARLVYGTRVSLLLAPAAALLATGIAALMGGVAGLAGGWLARLVTAGTDLVLSLPWLFLLITVRATLPLNISPTLSVIVTFALLGCLGWAGAARVVCADARSLRDSDLVLQARALGSGGWRLFWRQLLPNLRPVLAAQFWIAVPVFILTEANLGILGLGVAEPLPSWGSLLRELESYASLSGSFVRLVPLLVVIVTVSSFHVAMRREGDWR